MIKKLFDAECEKLEDHNYPGGGYNPPYGPNLHHFEHNYDRYAYQELLQVEWQNLLFASLDS